MSRRRTALVVLGIAVALGAAAVSLRTVGVVPGLSDDGANVGGTAAGRAVMGRGQDRLASSQAMAGQEGRSQASVQGAAASSAADPAVAQAGAGPRAPGGRVADAPAARSSDAPPVLPAGEARRPADAGAGAAGKRPSAEAPEPGPGLKDDPRPVTACSRAEIELSDPRVWSGFTYDPSQAGRPLQLVNRGQMGATVFFRQVPAGTTINGQPVQLNVPYRVDASVVIQASGPIGVDVRPDLTTIPPDGVG